MSNKIKRGRPAKPLILPKGKFTINDVVDLNPQIVCRLSIYTKVGKLVKQRVIRSTGKVVHRDSVGKPLNEFQTMASFRAVRARKANAKARKLSSITVDLTPAQVPVAA